MTIGGTREQSLGAQSSRRSHYMGSYAPVTTRANTSTSTRFAPALKSAREAALAVAPEVKTSSISTTLSPRTGRAGGGAKRALDVFSPLRAGEADLAAGRLDPQKRAQVARLAGLARNFRRQRRRLVEPPPPQPQRMQRHRRQEIGVGEHIRAGARHPASDRPGELGAVGIFEPMRERARRPVLEPRHRPGAGEHGRIGHRLGRDEALPKVLLERRPETLAKRPLDESHRAPAARAERSMQIRRGAAGKACRRIEGVERGLSQARNESAAASRPRRASRLLRVKRRNGVHSPTLARTGALREGRSGA